MCVGIRLDKSAYGLTRIGPAWLQVYELYCESGFRSTRSLSPCSVHSGPMPAGPQLTCPQPGPLRPAWSPRQCHHSLRSLAFHAFGKQPLAHLGHHSGDARHLAPELRPRRWLNMLAKSISQLTRAGVPARVTTLVPSQVMSSASPPVAY